MSFDAIEQFLSDSDLRPTTRVSYRGMLRSATADLGDLRKVSQGRLAAYMREWGRTRAPGTFNARLYALRSFYNAQGGLNPAKAIAFAREIRRTKAPPGRDQILWVIRSFGARERLAIRDRATVSVLYGCGLRASELCDLGVDDVDLAERRLEVVEGKGGKSRHLPIPREAARDLERWLAIRDHEGDRVFGFDRTTLSRRIKQAGRRSGAEARWHPHALRHAYATHLMDSGVSIRQIQALMGHSDIAVTQRYLAVSLGGLTATIDRHHALGRRPGANSAMPGAPTGRFARVVLRYGV